MIKIILDKLIILCYSYNIKRGCNISFKKQTIRDNFKDLADCVRGIMVLQYAERAFPYE